MNLILSVRDRLILPNFLPQMGGRIEMTVKLAILKKIQFSAEEIHEFELVDLPNGDVRGNQFKFRDIEVEVNEPEAAMLKKIPAKLEDKNEVTIDILPLLDKIDLL